MENSAYGKAEVFPCAAAVLKGPQVLDCCNWLHRSSCSFLIWKRSFVNAAFQVSGTICIINIFSCKTSKPGPRFQLLSSSVGLHYDFFLFPLAPQVLSLICLVENNWAFQLKMLFTTDIHELNSVAAVNLTVCLVIGSLLHLIMLD